MALAVFPATAPNPSFTVVETAKPVVVTAKFGDGYEQEIGYDLNQDQAASVDLTWENLTGTEKDTLVNFFLSCKGYLRFQYQTPGSASLRTWACKQWEVTLTYPGCYNVKATFDRKFDVS